jgi:c(7)-type cytochrome triheme protein
MRLARPKTTLKAALFVAALIVFAASCIQQQKKTDVTLTAAETPEPPVVNVSDSSFSKFDHSVAEHKQFECNSCHRREANSRELEFAGHDSCVGCHLSQFTNPGERPAMCAICHDKMDVTPPTMKTFPAKFIEGFNMKFDHAAHETGKGRPAQGCAHCHSPSGPGQSIPIGIATHNNCFGCHTPETKIGSCATCHALAPYNRTTQSEYAFKAIFRHQDHTARQGVSCNECHNVIAGAPNSRQVSNIQILEHLTGPGNNCAQCHNGRRAFTGNNPLDVNSCTRCHKGLGGAGLPPGTKTDEPATPPTQ